MAKSARSLRDTEDDGNRHTGIAGGPPFSDQGSEPDREVALRLAMLRHWHGDHLSAEHWDEVSRQVRTEVVEVSGTLAEVPLDHTDEPRPLFTPHRSDGYPAPAADGAVGAAPGPTGLPLESARSLRDTEGDENRDTGIACGSPFSDQGAANRPLASKAGPPAEVVFRPLRELGELVRTRQVSPVDLTETFLDRLRAIGPRYNAVVTLTPELARAQARRAERELAAGHWRGPLHGIPYGIKDLFATAGIPTSWGAAPFRCQVFDYDATVVRRLRQAGAVLIAKLAMVELAGGLGYRQPDASFTGPGVNPWGGTTWSGGSSSGSGAAVAAGLVPFAIGTETNGSIISPAANCGLAGLRPSYGRVSRHGGMPLAWSLDKPGPLALTADDCGLVLDAIAGFDADDHSTTPRVFSHDSASHVTGEYAGAGRGDSAASGQRRRFRLALPEGATDDAEPAVRENFSAALAVLGEVADIEPVALPDYPYAAVISTILLSESASIFAELARSGRTAGMTAPEDRYGIYARGATLAADYLRAQRIRALLARDLDRLLAPYDALVTPSRPTVAAPLGATLREPASRNAGTANGPAGSGARHEQRPRCPISAAGNLAGLPAISVPSGFTDDGLPTGIQFVGRAYEEPAILAVATAYQALTAWHRRHPATLLP